MWLILLKIPLRLAFIRTFFEILHVAGHKTQHFGTSLNDLDLHSRSHSYKKARTCTIMLLYGGMKQPTLLL